MKISTKGRYGLRAMIELAIRYDTGPVQIQTLSDCHGLSQKYLHTLLVTLKDHGLVRAVRGAHGGYMLAKDPVDISAGEIVCALEGDFATVDCVKSPEQCLRYEQCIARDVWTDLSASIQTALGKYSLKKMADDQIRKNQPISNYSI